MFLGLNLDEAQEFQTVPAGEYNLRITNAEMREGADSSKSNMLILKFDIEDQDEPTKTITRCLFFPHPDDDEKKRIGKINQMKYFAEAFGFDPSDELSLEDLPGATGWALLKEKSTEEYGNQNEITRFVVPS